MELFRGVDLTRLEPSLGTSQEEGAMPTDILFNLTCDRGTKWSDGPLEYLIPDQIQAINSVPSEETSLSTPVTCFQLSCYRRKMLTANVVVDSNLKPVSGRGLMVQSPEYQRHVKDELLGNRWAIGEIHSDRLRFSVTLATAEDLRPSCILSERLRALLQDSNYAEYAINPAPYEAAIKAYGTHYFAGGTFGARHVEWSRFRPDYYFSTRATSLGNLTDSIRAHFEQRFDRLDPAFEQNVHVEGAWFGRFPAKTGEDSQPGHYWPLTVSLKPITELLERGHPAKAQLAVAIRVWLMRAALRDWASSLQKISDGLRGSSVSWGLLMGVFEPGRLLERLQEQLAETVPEEAAVGRIGTLVETLEDFIGLMNDHTPRD